MAPEASAYGSKREPVRMKRVVVDLFKLRTPHCGLGQYCQRLGSALLRQAAGGAVEPRLWLRGKDHAALGASAELLEDATPAWRKEKVFRWLRPLRGLLPTEGPIDLWHATDQCCKHFPADPRVPVVLTIHDLNFLREKHKIRVERNQARVQRKVDRASCVTVISEFVAQEVRDHLNLRGKPVRVIYNGADRTEADAPQERPAFLPSGPFLFTIGAIAPKKNFHVLVPLMQRVPEMKLVIAGPDHHAYARQIRADAKRLGVADRVLVPGSVTDAQRTWLYAHCEAFLFPSLTEGFGLPVIEAMQHGSPVFCSRRTSLPEVAGPDAFYWESDTPDHLSQVFQAGMARVAADPTLGDRLRANAARFDWDQTAREYLEVYREVLGVSAESVKQAA